MVVGLQLDEPIRAGGVQPELEAAAWVVLTGDEQRSVPAGHLHCERLRERRTTDGQLGVDEPLPHLREQHVGAVSVRRGQLDRLALAVAVEVGGRDRSRADHRRRVRGALAHLRGGGLVLRCAAPALLGFRGAAGGKAQDSDQEHRGADEDAHHGGGTQSGAHWFRHGITVGPGVHLSRAGPRLRLAWSRHPPEGLRMTDDAPTSSVALGRERQSSIYRSGVLGRRPAVPTDFAELERRAKRASSPRGGPTSRVEPARGGRCGTTVRRSTAGPSFPGWPMGSPRDLSVDLLGTRLSSPILLARVGAGALLDPDCDLHVARAAAAMDVPYIFTNQGSTPMEECAAAMGESRRWVQLYWSTDEALVDSLIQRAEAIDAGALVVTLDTTTLGWRPQDLNLGSLPFAQGQGIGQYTSDPRFRDLVRERIAAPRPPASSRTSRSPSPRSGRCSPSPRTTQAASGRTSAPPCPGHRWRRSSTSTPTRA